MARCYSCERNEAGDEQAVWEQVHRDGHWRLTLAFDSSLPGWLVLVPRRHVEAIHHLSAAEAGGMGELLRRASAALAEVTGCVKTYVMAFAEAEGFAHLHFHIVPRGADLPDEQRGPRIFARLGVPADEQVSEADRTALAVRLQAALAR